MDGKNENEYYITSLHTEVITYKLLDSDTFDKIFVDNRVDSGFHDYYQEINGVLDEVWLIGADPEAFRMLRLASYLLSTKPDMAIYTHKLPYVDNKSLAAALQNKCNRTQANVKGKVMAHDTMLKFESKFNEAVTRMLQSMFEDPPTVDNIKFGHILKSVHSLDKVWSRP